MTDYILVRSKRKTVALYVRDGAVEVRAPWRIAKEDIARFVAANEDWIQSRLAKARAQAEQRAAFALDYGARVLYRGAAYSIAAREGHRAGFDGDAFYMPPGLPPEQIKETCVRIYRKLAKRDLTEKTLEFARTMGVTPSAIKINGAKTRWGSCSAKKSVNFSWRLVMADDDVMAYVVVHELAHLTELNHSARFWAVVARAMPDYRMRRARLKELQKRLTVENW